MRRDASGFWGFAVSLFAQSKSDKTFTYAYEHFDCLKLTDGGVISYQEKIVKPEPEIYRRLIERYALDSAACVFLDDSPANCQGAEAFGIRTILVQDRAAARRELRELLASSF